MMSSEIILPVYIMGIITIVKPEIGYLVVNYPAYPAWVHELVDIAPIYPRGLNGLN